MEDKGAVFTVAEGDVIDFNITAKDSWIGLILADFRRVDAQTTLPGIEQYSQEMDLANQVLEGSFEPLLHFVWRQNAGLLNIKKCHLHKII